jgi:hypothetical protein
MFWFLFAAVLLLQGGCRENPLLPKIKELVDLYGKQVAKPVLDPPPGTYYLPLELETVVMSTDTEDADIYYTTDGSNPTPGSSTLFDAATPLSISRSCTVKAVAVKKYWDDSQVMIGEYTIPFSVEQRKLQAPDHAADDWFGDAVAASDQYLVVGAYRKDVSAIDQAGAAYIFEKTASGWDNGKKVTAGSNADAGDWFGDSVAVSGDYVVVGSTFDEGDSPAPANTGAVYVFYKDPVSGWDDGFKITATGGQLDDRFGFSVAISGDWLIVGALGNDDLLANSGAAYIYERTGTNSWTQRHMFKSGTPMAGAVYGLSVAISGDYAVVGAPQETVSGTSFAGAAYVYYYDSVSGTWGGEIKLTALTSVENARFGYSVAISGYYIIVGAYGYEYAVPAVEEAAYVFHRINTYTWEQAPKLTAPDGQLECDFALTVAINSEFAVVGARLGGEGAVSSGSAYVYHRTGANTWNQGYEILPSDGQGDDYFGYFVGLTEDVLITGAHHKDSGGTDTGSAYIFE